MWLVMAVSRPYAPSKKPKWYHSLLEMLGRSPSVNIEVQLNESDIAMSRCDGGSEWLKWPKGENV